MIYSREEFLKKVGILLDKVFIMTFVNIFMWLIWNLIANSVVWYYFSDVSYYNKINHFVLYYIVFNLMVIALTIILKMQVSMYIMILNYIISVVIILTSLIYIEDYITIIFVITLIVYAIYRIIKNKEIRKKNILVKDISVVQNPKQLIYLPLTIMITRVIAYFVGNNSTEQFQLIIVMYGLYSFSILSCIYSIDLCLSWSRALRDNFKKHNLREPRTFFILIMKINKNYSNKTLLELINSD
jgi:hypothetical protein